MPLDGKRILVTGGSGGIGRAVSEAVASAGATVVIVARTQTRIDATLASLAGDGHLGLPFDVSDQGSWEANAAELGDLHGVVTAAGVLAPIGPLGNYPPEQFMQTVATNLFGTFLALHYTIAALRKNSGSAVTFSGGGATSPLPRFDAYASSKAAVVRLTENLSQTLAYDEVNINAVAPGMVMTPLHEATVEAGPTAVGEEYFEKTKRSIEEGDGVPPTLAAELTVFLLSDKASPITGKLISAPWDPWREESFRHKLATDPDFATLRRIDEMLFMKSDHPPEQ